MHFYIILTFTNLIYICYTSVSLSGSAVSSYTVFSACILVQYGFTQLKTPLLVSHFRYWLPFTYFQNNWKFYFLLQKTHLILKNSLKSLKPSKLPLDLITRKDYRTSFQNLKKKLSRFRIVTNIFQSVEIFILKYYCHSVESFNLSKGYLLLHNISDKN